MQIILSKENNQKEFIEFLAKDFIPEYLIERINKVKLVKLSNELDINLHDALIFAVKNLKVTESSANYTIRFDNVKKYKNLNASSIANIVTYGTRTAKGYNIVNKIFQQVVDNIDFIRDR